MNKDGFYISVSTEIIKENKDHDLFVNLELEQDNYFNAGVMLIDYQRWLSFTKVNEFISLVEKYKNNIIFWDQDILNKKFDGKYSEFIKYNSSGYSGIYILYPSASIKSSFFFDVDLFAK